MQTSNSGIDLIKQFEGLRLEAYKAVSTEKYYTIGYGHYGSDVRSNQAITVEQALELLKSDLVKFENAVNKYVDTYKFNQNQFDALVSFTYNCGVGNLDKLTNNGKRSIHEIAEKLPMYNKSGGVVLKGLTKRRQMELELFNKPYDNSTVVENVTENNSKYALGEYEITASSLRVRLGAGVSYRQKNKNELSADGQKHCTDTGALVRGTHVTVKKIVQASGGIWGLIPSGYIAMELNNKTFVKKVTDNVVNTVETSIKEYSLSKDGEMQLSNNFKVKEFRCKDGSDKILIDSNLVKYLQKIRDKFGKPVNINSAYRTEAYNKKIGGATKSKHMLGMASDIKISGVAPKEIAKYAEELGILGIGLYDTFVHIDTRPNKYFWYSSKCIAQTSFK